MTTDKIVTTAITAQTPQYPSGLPYSDQVNWILGAAASVIVTLLWLRRKTSRDSTEIAKDRAEENLIATLRAERDKAMAAAEEAWKSRTADAQEIAGLRAKNEYLARDVERLNAEVKTLREHVDELMKLVQLPGGLQLQPKT